MPFVINAVLLQKIRRFALFCKQARGLRLFMKYLFHNLRILFLFLLLVMAIPQAMAQKSGKKPFTVVIDPGHGGVDPGALGKKSKEKDINMSVSKLLSGLIKEKYPEIKIIFTRTTDVEIPLVKRANIANNANADLFISIHSNASKSKKANGCETFTLGAGSNVEAKAAAMYENEVILSEENFEEVYKGFDPRSSESYIIFELIRSHDMELSAELAQMVQRGMVRNSKLHDRGVSSAGFLVLHRTVMPSILVELGFITNSNDEGVIASKNGQKKLADVSDKLLKLTRNDDSAAIGERVHDLVTELRACSNAKERRGLFAWLFRRRERKNLRKQYEIPDSESFSQCIQSNHPLPNFPAQYSASQNP